MNLKHVIFIFLLLLMVAGCDINTESSKLDENIILNKPNSDIDIYFSYYQDTRTGCVYGLTQVSGGYTSFPLNDTSGKQVGCNNLDSMKLKEYLNLPIILKN